MWIYSTQTHTTIMIVNAKRIQLDRRWRWWKIIIHIVIIIITINNEYFYSMKKKFWMKITHIFFVDEKKTITRFVKQKKKKIKKILLQLWTMKVFFFSRNKKENKIYKFNCFSVKVNMIIIISHGNESKIPTNWFTVKCCLVQIFLFRFSKKKKKIK